MFFFIFAPNRKNTMKRYLLTLSFVFFALMARSGNVFIFEQFDNAYLPTGWSGQRCR